MTEKATTPPAHGEGKSSSEERLVVVGQAFLAVMVVLQVLNFLWQGLFFTFMFPYQLDYGEGPILQLALRIVRGQGLYPPLNADYPYAIASYLPFYYLLSAAGVWLAGPSFVGGRLISLLATLVVALSTGLIVWDHTKHRFASLATGGVILAIPVFLVWSTLMRVDMVALACSIAGFYLFTRGRRGPGIVLFALGVFTRRTNITAIFVAFVGLALQRKWRQLVVWALAQGALIAALVVGAMLVTKGTMYEQLRWHTSTSLGKQWSWDQVLLLISIAGRNWPVYFAVSAVGAAWCLARARHRVLFIYFLTACAVYLTSGRVGSTFNYFLEPLAVGTVMAGVCMAELAQLKSKAAARAGFLAMAGALALQMVWTDGHLRYTISLLRPEASLRDSRHVVERLRESPGMVLCEDVGLIELAGKETPLDPFEFTQLARAGAIKPEPVYEDVRQGRFSLVVFRFDAREIAGDQVSYSFLFDRWPMEMVGGVLDRYRLDEKAGPYYLYVPK